MVYGRMAIKKILLLHLKCQNKRKFAILLQPNSLMMVQLIFMFPEICIEDIQSWGANLNILGKKVAKFSDPFYKELPGKYTEMTLKR